MGLIVHCLLLQVKCLKPTSLCEMYMIKLIIVYNPARNEIPFMAKRNVKPMVVHSSHLLANVKM